MSDKKKRKLEEALSREVLTLKQKINIQGLNRDAQRADLALAEKKHDDLKKEEEINTKTFESLLDAKDLEIQQLKNKFHEMSSIVFEKDVADEKFNDLQRETSQRIKDLEDTVAVKNEEVRTLRNKMMEISEDKEALETQMRRDGSDDETVAEIGQLVDLLRGEVQDIKDNVRGGGSVEKPACSETALMMREMRDFREEKQRLESKILRLTIEKMQLKRKVHDLSRCHP